MSPITSLVLVQRLVEPPVFGSDIRNSTRSTGAGSLALRSWRPTRSQRATLHCCARTRGPHLACGPVDHQNQRIISASCTENGGDCGETGRDVPPDDTDMPSTSVTNRVCIAAGKATKSASQYWTHRNLKPS